MLGSAISNARRPCDASTGLRAVSRVGMLEVRCRELRRVRPQRRSLLYRFSADLTDPRSSACILSPSSTCASRVLGRQLGVFSARHAAPFINPGRFQRRTNICREITLNFLLPQASPSSASAHRCGKASSPQHPFPPQAPA